MEARGEGNKRWKEQRGILVGHGKDHQSIWSEEKLGFGKMVAVCEEELEGQESEPQEHADDEEDFIPAIEAGKPDQGRHQKQDLQRASKRAARRPGKAHDELKAAGSVDEANESPEEDIQIGPRDEAVLKSQCIAFKACYKEEIDGQPEIFRVRALSQVERQSEGHKGKQDQDQNKRGKAVVIEFAVAGEFGGVGHGAEGPDEDGLKRKGAYF